MLLGASAYGLLQLLDPNPVFRWLRGGLCALDKFVAMADERDPRDYEAACKPRGKSKL